MIVREPMCDQYLRLAQEESFFLYDRFQISGPLYFGMLRFSERGKAYSKSYDLSRRAGLLEKYYDCPWGNVFQSQNILIAPRRLKQNVGWMGLNFADLDCHDKGKYQGIHYRFLVGLILDHLSASSIPLPSAIVFSGRGLHVKWHLEEILPRTKMPEWDLVQKKLVHVLQDFGADSKARDANRVLRTQGSTNPRSGKIVREVWPQRRQGQLSTVRFEDLKKALHVDSPDKLSFFSNKNHVRFLASDKVSSLQKDVFFEKRALSFSNRGHHMVSDLMKLADIRGWKEHGIPDGFRDLFLFYLIVHVKLSYIMSAQPRIYHEVFDTVRDLLPGHWDDVRVYNALSSVYARVAEMEKGKLWEEFEGQIYPHLYTPSNQYLIDIFEITDNEIVRLDYIQTPSTLSRQRQRKRLEAGSQTQIQISENRAERVEQAKLMKKLGHKVSEIASIFDVTERNVRRWFNN